MKKILGLLLLLPTLANALYVEFYFDKDGQTHGVHGGGGPEVRCYGTTYWNGQACVPIEIAKICESQGGVWNEVQVHRPPLSDDFESGAVVRERAFIDMCVCPNQKVWDGKKCRSDVPLDQQCKSFSGGVRMTKEFLGSDNCP